jgi:Gas vesicle protein K
MTEAKKITPEEVAAAIQQLKSHLAATAGAAQQHVDVTPESVEQGLAKLVLTLIELLRQILERQAIRRMEGGSLTGEQVESMGQALMKLEQKVHELTTHFGLRPEDLNLDLGPIGKLLDD